MSEDELKRLQEQAREDRKLIKRASETLAEISRGPGLEDHQTEVLVALRLRLEGKERKSLEDLLGAAGDLKGKKDLGSALTEAEGTGSGTDWPEIEDKPKDWPTL